jgi:hypothetical protein
MNGGNRSIASIVLTKIGSVLQSQRDKRTNASHWADADKQQGKNLQRFGSIRVKVLSPT